MREHALEALEFHRVLDVVAGYATSDAGAEAVRARRPDNDPGFIANQLDQVDEMVSWLIRDPNWAPPDFPDIREQLNRLSVSGAIWNVGELAGGLRLMLAAREARKSVLPHASEFEHLRELAGDLFKDEGLQKRLVGAIDDDGESLRDSASPELNRLRRAIRNTRADLIDRLEKLMSDLPDRSVVSDGSVTVRNGRYCIPVRREGHSEVGGIVHDESASRATLFVEPPTAIEPMNHLRELEVEERREVDRILRELSDAVRPHAGDLQDSLHRLVRLDSLFARGRYALARNCTRPKLVDRDEEGFRIVNGRHPLLLEAGREVVPFELIMHPGEHTLLITGPNAGGKTVLIKAVGLVSAMTQTGILPTVGPGSELPVYKEIFADIGDEQSIDASLSTFTAHLRNLTEILDGADAASLCLIDEIGGATDPVEGTALARAVLLELAERGCLTMATSHLGGLKTLPSEHSAIVSAGLGFDTEKLEPLYKLTKGRPGRSYALDMARRVGFPEKVVSRARESLSEAEVDAERLLADLEEKSSELEGRLLELEAKERKVKELEAALAQQAKELDARQEELETEGRRQAREFLLEARKQVEEALSARREEADQARSDLEASLREHTQALREATAKPGVERVGEEVLEFEPGDRVWVEVLDQEGRVVELRGDEVLVEVGGVKLQLNPGALGKLDESKQEKRKAAVSAGGGGWSDGEAQHEIHLRGLTAEEARAELIRALDAAVQAGLSSLKIVHGKGGGVLRAAVQEYVRTDRRVRSHRMGAPHEGGSGVTFLELE